MKKHRLITSSISALALSLSASPANATEDATHSLKIATFNASLNRDSAGELLQDLATPGNQQANNAAETIQRVNPDIILINEFDYDADHRAVNLFRENYLEVSINGSIPVQYPYAWTGPVNTGVSSGYDLNHNGKTDDPDDGWGYGKFPGQYGLVVYSKYPIKTEQVRTFQHFLWKDMPHALLPENEDGTSWYSDEVLSKFPLSSKTHADIPVDVDGTTIHVLADHPTPPIDGKGPERRNSRRNFDEIRMWADYVSGKADYLYDDKGVHGGLDLDANFVILGDHNSDPYDGNSWQGAIAQLLNNPRIVDTQPTSDGGATESALQAGVNISHRSDPKYDTADFNDNGHPGNLRVDYVLPNAGTTVEEAHVFWPKRDDALFRLTGLYPFPTSDHRLVWAQLRFPTAPPATQPQQQPNQQQSNNKPQSHSHHDTLSSDKQDKQAVSKRSPQQLAKTGIPFNLLVVTGLAAALVSAGTLIVRKRRA